MRLAATIASAPPGALTAEEEIIGKSMWGMLNAARPIVCPPEQLNAVPDDVFEDLADAFSYASRIRLPFEAVYLDYCDPLGNAPPFHQHRIEGGGDELGFQLRGVVAGEDPDSKRTTFLPIVGLRDEPPEELGGVIVEWEDGDGVAAKAPDAFEDEFEMRDGRTLSPVFFSLKAVMNALSEEPKTAPAVIMGARRHGTGAISPSSSASSSPPPRRLRSGARSRSSTSSTLPTSNFAPHR